MLRLASALLVLLLLAGGVADPLRESLSGVGATTKTDVKAVLLHDKKKLHASKDGRQLESTEQAAPPAEKKPHAHASKEAKQTFGAAEKHATEKHLGGTEKHATEKHRHSTTPIPSALPSALPPPSPTTDAPASDSSPATGIGLSITCIGLLVGIAVYAYGRDLKSAAGNLSSWGMQIASFFVLVGVQSCALLLFKVCQTSGSYSFSPASSVALTEACKLVLAVTLHMQHVHSTGTQLLEGLSPKMVLHYFGLACCYTVNNQLTFYCFEIIDPGTFALGKSVAPYLVALMLRFTGDKLNQLQWVCILLQCILIAVTQYNACKAGAALSLYAYALLLLAVSITAVSSVWNQKVVKGFAVPVNLQNAVLYTFGFTIAVISYAAIPDSRGSGKGFFTGYDTLACFLVLFQAFHGLAVTLVYKYADAIVKNFANSCVMAILVVVSAYFFNVVTTIHSWLGVAGVVVTTYAYMNIALKMPAS